MEVLAYYIEGSKFEVNARGHRVICDQPIDNGGSDEGMSPPEFLLASLATCAAYYATQYLKTRGLAANDLKVQVSAEKALQPARLASFRIEVFAPGLEERHQAGILRAVRACLIHNTLLGGPEYRNRRQFRSAGAGLVAWRKPVTIRGGTEPWNGKPKLNSPGD
jgi:putative redox protein